MKLSTLQGWYRAHAATGAAASEQPALDTLLSANDPGARDAAIEQLLATEAGADSLRLVAAVQPTAAEAGVVLAQADWRERRVARESRPAAPTWAPYALAAGIALFFVGVAEVRHAPKPAPGADIAATPAAPAASRPAPDDVIFNGKLDDEPVAANAAAAKPTVMFRDDFGS